MTGQIPSRILIAYETHDGFAVQIRPRAIVKRKDTPLPTALAAGGGRRPVPASMGPRKRLLKMMLGAETA